MFPDVAVANPKIDLLNFNREELNSELQTRFGVEKYRGNQLIQWLYRERLTDFEGMTNVSREFRARLAETYLITRPEIITTQLSKDGTRKYLFRLADGAEVESVLICQPTRYTLCISSQVGCAIGCKFCRTGLMGLKRHLKTSEILGQVLAVQDDCWRRFSGAGQGNSAAETPPDLFQNIVFMGMGEPLHNFDNVSRAVNLLTDEGGFNFSPRKITVSTSGLIPAINRFGSEGVRANLAISLNATTDEVRTKIIPINKKWPLTELLQSLRSFPLTGRKKLTIEYVMLRGVNDTDEDMKRLPGLLADIPSKVNLIPYNENAGLGYFGPRVETVHRWHDYLLKKGLNSTIRWSKGQDISAACGQLATTADKARAQL